MSCEHCKQFIVMLWQMSGHERIVLWDGQCTYWTDEMIASSGYEHVQFDELLPDAESTFTFIGIL